jgi:hypothetical protein
MTVDRFERLIRAGVYGEDDPLFLWMGRLYEKMAPGELHVFVTTTLAQYLARIVPRGWYVLQEQPIHLNVDSMPEPDVAVVQGTIRDYLNGRAKAEDVRLIVEVADSSATFDTREKLTAYAKAAIPVYWIIHLKAGRITVFGDPSGPAESPSYRSRIEFVPGEVVPVVIDGTEIDRIKVDDLLP